MSSAESPTQSMNQRLLVVGWDGADWDVINPLMDQGLMPNLESIIDSGVMGHLATVQPQCLPLIWSTIATGCPAEQHRVLGYLRPRGEQVEPCYLAQRNRPAFWDFLSSQNNKCHVIGWPSFPAETTHGVFVSELFSRVTLGFEHRDEFDRRRLVSPPDMLDELWDMRILPGDVSVDQLRHFVPDLDRVDQETDPSLAVLATAIAETSNTHSAATWAMQNRPWEMTTVYYDLIDQISHVFMAYQPPKLRRIADREFQLYQHVISATYQFADMMLGRLMDLAGEDAGVIVFSDHGFRSGNQRLLVSPQTRAQTGLHRPLGMLAMKGTGIPADEWIWSGSLLDVAPTILDFFGYKAEGMMGRSLIPERSNLSAKELIRDQPKFSVSDCNLSEPEVSLGIRNLVNDGFIETSHLDEDPANRALDAEQFNLSQSLIEFGQLKNAVVVLNELIARRPENVRPKLQLANCYLSLNQHDECRQMLDRALAQDVPELYADQIRGRLELATGNFHAALDHFFAVQQSQPVYPGIDSLIGTAYVGLENSEQAKLAFTKALARNPDDEQALYELGRCLVEEGKFPAAVESFLQAISIRGRFVEAHLALGQALAEIGEIEKAKTAFDRCLALRPEWGAPLNELRNLGFV